MTSEQAKYIADFFANLMEQESQKTTKVIAAVPDDRRDYKPDPKSRTAWELAQHVATGDLWFLDSICDAAFTWDPDFDARMLTGVSTISDLVAMYNREYPKRIARLRAASGEQLATVADFFGHMQAPAITYVGIANNHGVHHRGQLAAYLRAMGSRVPELYGPTADSEAATT